VAVGKHSAPSSTEIKNACAIVSTATYSSTDSFFFLRFIAEKVCTACSGTSYKIVPLTNLNKYLCNDKTEIKVNININNSNEKSSQPPHPPKKCDYRLVLR
jgi:hypothetical protein